MTSSARAGFQAGVYITSVPSVSMTNEAMTDSGDHKTYNVTNAAHQCFDKSATFVVQTAPDGSTWTTVTSGFVINYAIGQIVFAVAVSGGTPSCRVASGKYFPFAFLGFARSFEIAVSGETYDSTALVSPPSPWKTYVQGLLSADVKLSTWWIDTTMLNHMANVDLLILRLYPNQSANQRFQGYAPLKTSNIKAATNALNSEDLDFQIAGQLFYIAS